MFRRVSKRIFYMVESKEYLGWTEIRHDDPRKIDKDVDRNIFNTLKKNAMNYRLCIEIIALSSISTMALAAPVRWEF